jgi:16S rRNA A1518/A1519 N6-dimethyltransferase RsmA/KsgA/DIM1 with predicted DNA glycosylase/AP lyase activity
LPNARKWMAANSLEVKKEVTLKLCNARGEPHPVVYRFLVDTYCSIELCRNMPRAAVYLRDRPNRGVSLVFR